MKRILIIPKDSTGILDIRKLDYMILDNIEYIEDMQKKLLETGRMHANYKFAQFEPGETIPIFLKVKDRISAGTMIEFDVEKVKFSDVQVDDIEDLIKERFLNPLIQQKHEIGSKVVDLMISEKLGAKLTDEDYKPLKTENTKVSKLISTFDYKKHLKETV